MHGCTEHVVHTAADSCLLLEWRTSVGNVSTTRSTLDASLCTWLLLRSEPTRLCAVLLRYTPPADKSGLHSSYVLANATRSGGLEGVQPLRAPALAAVGVGLTTEALRQS